MVNKHDIEQIVSFERDMDCITSHLQYNKDLPDVKRVILTRDSFGGKKSKGYVSINEILFESKKLTDDCDTFTELIYEKMVDFIEDNSKFMFEVWNKNIMPYIEKNKNTLFLDVGWKGGMQYWSSKMYELTNPYKKACASLVYTKKGDDKDCFRDLMNTPDNFSETELYKYFLENNAKIFLI